MMEVPTKDQDQLMSGSNSTRAGFNERETTKRANEFTKSNVSRLW